jgi:hypothetical protein
VCGISVALLIIAPYINYSIPVTINSFPWIYMVISSGLFGFFLLSQRLHWILKTLVIFLFINSFFSQIPFMSFNANVLVIITIYLFLLFQKCEYKILLNWIAAAFWLEVALTLLQLMGKDTLLNFGGVELSDQLEVLKLGETSKPVFFGTVMQYMRFGSLLAVISPLLVLKRKIYIIPVIVLALLSKSSTFALSVAGGLFVYGLLMLPKTWARLGVIALFLAAIGAYAIYDWGSWSGAIYAQHGGRLITWVAVIKTWMFDTAGAKAGAIWAMNGPFNLQWFLIGHGMDSFLPLFPIYKHDLNPFPQAHNSWFQFLWEIGFIGFSLIAAYSAWLMKKMYDFKRYDLVGGLVCLAINMFLAFPDRMTQSELLIVVYLAYCQRITYGGCYGRS